MWLQDVELCVMVSVDGSHSALVCRGMILRCDFSSRPNETLQGGTANLMLSQEMSQQSGAQHLAHETHWGQQQELTP